jgi:glycosyltransferase involved in cell wall biosynthesis
MNNHLSQSELDRSPTRKLRFTLFVPTFNRAETIGETIRSLENSRFRDFEVIIIDDGSEDQTFLVVARERKAITFPLTFVFQKNSGKAGAHNTALQFARGELFVTLDAGDLLLPDALTHFLAAWESIPEENRPDFAGVSALCVKEDGTLSGEPYSGEMDKSYLELVSKTPLSGEKRQAIRTGVMKQFPYPRIRGEKHIRPDLILRRMSHKYKMRFINANVQVNIREPDGITANINSYRMENPNGFRLFYLEEITLNKGYFDKGKLYDDSWRYVRFSMHAGVSFSQQWDEVDDRLLWLLSIPQATAKWLVDKYRMHS